MKPFSSPISVRRPFWMSCAIDGRWKLLRACALVPFIMCASTAASAAGSPFGGGEQLRRLDPGDALELIAERAADPDRLAGEADHHAPDHLGWASRSLPLMPVAALTPLRMPLTHSFDQRSPHRFVVTSAPSMRREHVAQLLARAA